MILRITNRDMALCLECIPENQAEAYLLGQNIQIARNLNLKVEGAKCDMVYESEEYRKKIVEPACFFLEKA